MSGTENLSEHTLTAIHNKKTTQDSQPNVETIKEDKGKEEEKDETAPQTKTGNQTQGALKDKGEAATTKATTVKDASEEEKRDSSKIYDGEELGILIDKEYKLTSQTQKFITDQISISDIKKLVMEKDEFLKRAAKQGNSLSLAFIANTLSKSELKERFNPCSDILEYFIHQLKLMDKSRDQKVEVLKYLLYFNEEAVDDRISHSECPILIRLLLDVHKNASYEKLFKNNEKDKNDEECENNFEEYLEDQVEDEAKVQEGLKAINDSYMDQVKERAKQLQLLSAKGLLKPSMPKNI